MKILPLALSALTATAPLAASADHRHYAHKHYQPQYHQPYVQRGHGYHQPRRQMTQAEQQRRNAKLIGGLVVLGLVLNAYNNKRD